MFTSLCDATMIGHVNNLTEPSNMTEHHVECFYAERHDKALYQDQIGKRNENALADVSLAQTGTKDFKQRRANMKAEHVATDETDLMISEINKKNLGWTADVCMLQTSHPDYDHKECGGASLVQKKNDGG